MGTSTIIKVLSLLFLSFSIAIPGHAATQGQRITEIHYIMNYPNHIQVQTVSNAHVISTEAFLEVNKGWHLVKSTNSEIYVEKEFTQDSPLSPLLTILRIKGNEPLTIERTGLFPINQINLFIQFENDPLKA